MRDSESSFAIMIPVQNNNVIDVVSYAISLFMIMRCMANINLDP